MKCILFCIIIMYLNQITFSMFCYWNTGCPYKYFSSKTPYDSVRGDIRDSIIKLKGCKPISIWGLYRHGKRHPSAFYGGMMKDAVIIKDLIVTSYENGNSSLCAQDVENLRNFSLSLEMFDVNHRLSSEGYQEMFQLSRRLKQAFPELLSKLSGGRYTFRSSYGSWIENSAEAFVKGLDDENLILEEATIGPDVMSPFKTCGKYQKEVRKNRDTYTEAYKYMNTSDYLSTKDRIQRRTGINFTLSDDNITALYDLCRYTQSGNDNIKSPWCAIFTTEDLKTLEYVGDLRHYYRNGYGTPINAKFGSIPLADLLRSFSLAKEGKMKNIVAYFSHATILDMVYVALKLFHDEVAVTGSYRNPDRKWRSSKISTFSANFMAVLNRCEIQNATDYNVIFYLNEEPLGSICKEGICSWQEFEDKLSPFLNATIDFCEFAVPID